MKILLELLILMPLTVDPHCSPFTTLFFWLVVFWSLILFLVVHLGICVLLYNTTNCISLCLTCTDAYSTLLYDTCLDVVVFHFSCLLLCHLFTIIWNMKSCPGFEVCHISMVSICEFFSRAFRLRSSTFPLVLSLLSSNSIFILSVITLPMSFHVVFWSWLLLVHLLYFNFIFCWLFVAGEPQAFDIGLTHHWHR